MARRINLGWAGEQRGQIKNRNSAWNMENAWVIYIMRGVILMETAMDLWRAWFVVDGARQQVNVAQILICF